jgi:hypothetical protein
MFCVTQHDGKELPDVRKHALLMTSVFSSTYHCEQLKLDEERQITNLDASYFQTLGKMHANRNNRN